MDDSTPSFSAEAELDLRTVRDFVRWGASRFNAAGLCFGHGFRDALDEAAALVLHALHLQAPLPDELWAAALTEGERTVVMGLFRRRIEERIPCAYLTREAWFAGLRFHVDERVLIPRSPIAEWIERRFEPWLDGATVERILDIGTGSGCIAIACAHAFPEASVDAVDVEEAALTVAARNVREHGLEDRVRVQRSDLFEAADGRYDLIVSNPPYVPVGDRAHLPGEFAHEPAVALFAGDDGLDCLDRLLARAGPHLTPRGILVVEVGVARAALETRYRALDFVWLELQRGGENVFLLNAAGLRE